MQCHAGMDLSSLVESVTVALLGLRHHFLNRLQILSTSIFTIVHKVRSDFDRAAASISLGGRIEDFYIRSR